MLNVVVFALGVFIMLLGVQGLLDDGRIMQGPSWNWAFIAVPFAAAANVRALAKPYSAVRWLWAIWIDLNGTRVTASRVDRLERALPGCKVFWYRTAAEPR